MFYLRKCESRRKGENEDMRQLKQNHRAGKWPEMSGKAPRDPEIICRGDNNPQRGAGKQIRKKK